MPRVSTKPTIMLILNVSQAARALNMRPEAIREFILMGKLDCRTHKGKLLIPVSSLEALIQSFPKATLKRSQHA